MFSRLLSICTLAVCLTSVTLVEAQDNPANSPAGSGADTACRDFVIMDTVAQTKLVKQLAGANDADVSNTDSDTRDTGETKPMAGDYTLDSVVAACRNNSDMTVGDAIAKGSGGTSQGSSGTSGKSE